MLFNKGDKKSKRQSIKNILPAISSKSAYAESFRTLRANLYFSFIDKPVKSIVVTSALQSEGKTNTSVNLGYTIANTGKKVLLVDTDLRKPFLTELFDLRGKPGFTDLVVDTLDRPLFEGCLDEYSLGDLIHLAKFQKLTGRLDLVSESNNIAFYFRDGVTMEVVWRNRPPESSLMAALVNEKILKAEAVKQVTGQKKESGRRFRNLLLSMGFITRADLEKRLAVLAAEAVRMASDMDDGRFTFTHSPWESMELSVYPDADFELMYRELFGRAEDLKYINRAIDGVVLQNQETENLFVIGAGKIPPNPSEVISSERAETIIGLLKQKFDFIIFDIAPVLPASDAMLMAPRTDGTLLVVRSGYGNKKIVKRVVDQFRQSNLPILGTVLNRVDVKRRDYYYQYYREY